ncbi:MAG TPA: tRNA (guanosine(46)-N7)-methyltransferase TrmB [Gammaproteobacteria bacterium]|jgi:tRNA (guanine-N7-)-methyltransferase|nr:tRNA (guanosine(46)-N7)-methyltransferase TrmB [Gammaproteobacteria bacterium]
MSQEFSNKEGLFNPRRIRSFVRREGKLTKGQQNALNDVWPLLGVPLIADKVLDFDVLFGRRADTVLEIGFGNGLSLADMAEAAPNLNFFGVEVHRPGVGSLLVQLKKRDITNVRVSQDDAVDVVTQQIADGSLHRVQIFFPDPWHKKRHNKRRLINAAFIQLILTKLKPGGHFHVATDWEPYAEQVLEELTANEGLTNTADRYCAKPDYRPTTKYEQRGIRHGHGVYDMVFQKRI